MPKANPFVWTKLVLPTVTPNTARAALAALAGLSGQPRIVLEVSGRDGVVSWKLGCPARAKGRALSALSAQLPGLRAEALPSTLDGLRADTAAGIRLRGAARLPLNHAAIEPTVRGLLGALASTHKAELVHVQLILGPRFRPSAVPASRESAVQRAVGSKLAEHRFACEIRVAASTQDVARSRSLIGRVVGALRHLEAPGVRIHVVRSSARAFSKAASPVLVWPNRLNLSDAVPFTGWPVTSSTPPSLPGVPSPHPRLIPPTETVSRSGRVIGHATTSPARPVALSAADSLRHLHLLGPTGVGKSNLMAQLALQDIAASRGVAVIDPKGDLIDDILARADERRLDDIVVLDSRDAAPVGVNGLANVRDAELAADIQLGVLHSLYADAWGPRTHDVLHAALLTLARRGDASLAVVPLLITNAGFRRSIVGRESKADPLGVGGFWSWWEQISEAERQQATAPLLRRLRPILMRPGIRGVLGQRHPKFDLTDVFTKRRILLVSLAKGTIGPEASALLGSLVVSQLWMAALGRAAVAPEKRHPTMLHIDEISDYLRLPGDLGDALAQARGLGLGMTLAHQHLGQLPKSIHDAVMANARSRAVFQVSTRDAREFAGQSRGQLQPEDFESLPAFHAYAQLLSGNAVGPWVSLTTDQLGPPLRDPATVRARSSATYGQPLTEIEADLLSLVDRPADDALGRVGRRKPTGGDHD